MAVKTSALHGVILDDFGPPAESGDSRVKLPGSFKGKPHLIGINSDLLSKHFLLVGGTGSGKTNLFYFFVDQLRKTLDSNDVMIIFDAKGDFYEKFYRPGDALVSNSRKHEKQTAFWNIFKELKADGWEDNELLLNAQEITRSLFREAIENNKSQPFFPNAARDMLSAILLQLMRSGREDKEFRNSYLVNEPLKNYFDALTAARLADFLGGSKDLASVMSYIGDGTSNQGLGVMAELQSVVREIFIGVFAKRGDFSMREFVRSKGGRVLFIEYDLSTGSTLTPVYRLFLDLALKEALGRNKSEGNVYLILDEFKLVPHSQHIDDAVNFGRSLGVKVIAGLQSIEQLYEIYGDSRGKNIAAGFSSIFSFRANDSATRSYVSGLFGSNIVLDQYKMVDNNVVQEKRDGYTVQDWDMTGLKVGEAIVGLPFSHPFRFKFNLFGSGR
jgi:type IV secretory pathway TraG/TraD family ATPase VirD4